MATGMPSVWSLHSHLSHVGVPGLANGHSPSSPLREGQGPLELLRSCRSPGDEGSEGGSTTTPEEHVSLVCLSHSTTVGGSWLDPYSLFSSFVWRPET